MICSEVTDTAMRRALQFARWHCILRDSAGRDALSPREAEAAGRDALRRFSHEMAQRMSRYAWGSDPANCVSLDCSTMPNPLGPRSLREAKAATIPAVNNRRTPHAPREAEGSRTSRGA